MVLVYLRFGILVNWLICILIDSKEQMEEEHSHNKKHVRWDEEKLKET